MTNANATAAAKATATASKATASKARKPRAKKMLDTPPAFSVRDAALATTDGLKAQGRMESAQAARDKAALAFRDMIVAASLTTNAFRGATKDKTRGEGQHCQALRQEVAMTWLSAAERRVIETANDKANGSPYHKAMTKVTNAVNRFLDHVDRMAKAEAEAEANGGKGKGKGKGKANPRTIKTMSEVLTDGFNTMLKRLGNDKAKSEPTGANHDAVRKVLEKALKDALAEMAKQ